MNNYSKVQIDRVRTRESGLKLTPQRLAILDYLRDNTDHPSAEDVYAAVAKQFPTMSFATVYNTLETLRRRGELRELTIDSRRKRFDPNPAPHHHLICVRCRRIVDIHASFPLAVPAEVRAEFELLGNHVEFYGICNGCSPEDGEPGKEIPAGAPASPFRGAAGVDGRGTKRVPRRAGIKAAREDRKT